MIHKVSVVKKITYLMMTMALAVAMVACSGAAGTTGPAGPAGPPGQDAPTPEPTDPTTPPEPTEPAGPTGAAPEVSTPFKAVYLALEGTGAATSHPINLDSHITDTDSRIKFSASSSDPTVATATPPVGGRSVTITAKTVGTATITVTAQDGDNSPLMADISVTVVRRNDQPTTNDLSKADIDELEKKLFVNDGARTDTVTVMVTPGGTSSEPVEDSIAGFKVVYGAKKTKTSTKVAVGVANGTAANQYVITVTPTKASLGEGSEKIMIYPMDMFGAESRDAWEFSAMFNTPPDTLVDSLGTIRLTRPIAPAAGADAAASLSNRSSYAFTVDGDGTADDSVALIKIEDYFDIASLQRMRKTGVPGADIFSSTVADVTTEKGKMDEVGDTVCAVSYSTALAVVQELNEAGTGGALLTTQTNAATVNAAAGNVQKALLITDDQALGAIRIDSRYSSLGSDKIVNDPAFADPPSSTDAPKMDVVAKKEGAFGITIRCTDRDATAEVTGTVVVQQET